MTPNIQTYRNVRGRWFVFLISTALWGLAVLSALEPEPAHALNGASRALLCQNCSSSSDFIAAGVAQAQSSGVPGLYVIVSGTYARTGLIQVTGQVPACGLSCGGGLLNVSGTALSRDGSPLGSDSGLNDIDVSLFAMDRAFPFEVDVTPGCGAQQSACTDAFGTSTDSGVGIVIGDTLQGQGFNVGSIPPTLSLAVKFENGDVAIFIHVQNGDIWTWKWAGYAWNAQHQTITRNGTPTNNPNTSGSGGGSGSGSNGSLVYGFSGYSNCVFNVSETVPSGGVSGNEVTIVTTSYTPC